MLQGEAQEEVAVSIRLLLLLSHNILLHDLCHMSHDLSYNVT